MATFANRGNVSSGATASAYPATAAFTPAATEQLVIWVANSIIGASGTTPSSISGWGKSASMLTTFLGGGGSPIRYSLWTLSGPAASSSSYAVDFGGTNQSVCVAHAGGFDGVTGTVVQVVRGTDTAGSNSAITITLNAFGASGNVAYGAFNDGTWTQTATAGTGFTLGANLSRTSIGRFVTEYQLGQDTTVDIFFSGNCIMNGFALELQATASSGGAPYYINRRKRRPRG